MKTRQAMELKAKDANRESEYPEMRFGVQAVERGFITSSNLTEVMGIQAMEKGVVEVQNGQKPWMIPNLFSA